MQQHGYSKANIGQILNSSKTSYISSGVTYGASGARILEPDHHKISKFTVLHDL